MKKITIKKFGPIDDSGDLDITPVTIFCGRQGSGKSTIAKLIATFSWLEKSLVKQSIKEKDITTYNHFQNKFCGYQYLSNFFKNDSFLHYEGDAFSFTYELGHLVISHKEHYKYVMPQIIYSPAERNFMTAIEQAEKIKRLPPALSAMQEEYIRALGAKNIDYNLPIKGFSIKYDKLNKTVWVTGNNYKVKIQEAASGIQSLTPLVMVTKYLSAKVNSKEQSPLSVEEREKLQKQVNLILDNDKLSEELKNAALERLNQQYHNDCFWNIVEEPEQNLHPESQQGILNVLLAERNRKEHNGLILTTHSPYILNDLSLAIKAQQVKNIAASKHDILDRLDRIVPIDSCTEARLVSIFQINDGLVNKLEMCDDIPSDDNFLNKWMEDSNQKFDELIGLEDEAKKY
jgi:predicted ATPase